MPCPEDASFDLSKHLVVSIFIRGAFYCPLRTEVGSESANMVSYTAVQASNSTIKTALPADLIAVFVGGTNGIGEYTLKQFAQHTVRPRVYFVGRSQAAGDRIAEECSALNPTGVVTFIKRETSLIRNVDELCQELKSREKTINLLFLTTGTLDFYTSIHELLSMRERD